MKELEKEIAAAAEWLAREGDRVRFGEVAVRAVRLVLHAGRVAWVERTVAEKEQPAGKESRQ